jgi:hypothetical protein
MSSVSLFCICVCRTTTTTRRKGLDDDDGHDARPSTRTDPSAACDDNEIEIEIEIEIKSSQLIETHQRWRGDPMGRFLNHNPWDLDQDQMMTRIAGGDTPRGILPIFYD